MDIEENLETDGVKGDTNTEIDKNNETQATPEINGMKSVEKLPDGFGFTKETKQFRSRVDDVKPSATKTSEDFIVPYNSDESKDETITDDTDAVCVLDENPNTPVEIDIIFTKSPFEERIPQPPSVPIDYCDMSPSSLPVESTATFLCWIPLGTKRPDKQSLIVIFHSKADKHEGDKFGASLCTFKVRRKDGEAYFRHFLVDVDKDGPAEQMKIETKDELVLLNEVFTPELKHTEVLELFRDVKVDGKTRLFLVIRRVQNKKKWEWIETSAILSPDEIIEDRAYIKDLQYRPVHDSQIEVPKTKHLFKAPGTQKYLDICDGKVTIDTMKGDNTDRTKNIWKRTKYWMDTHEPSHIDYAATLCDVTDHVFIGVDEQEKITLHDKPTWFKMIKLGSKVRFQCKEVYLGYDRDSGEVKTGVAQCVFEELPALTDNLLNHVGHPSECTSDDTENLSIASSERSNFSDVSSFAFDRSEARSAAPSLQSIDSRNRTITSSQSSVYSGDRTVASSQTSVDSGNRSIVSSQKSVDSDKSSTLSSQVSIDFGGDSPVFYAGASDETSALSLSQSSGTSGYRSENPTDELNISPTKDSVVDMIKNNCNLNAH